MSIRTDLLYYFLLFPTMSSTTRHSFSVNLTTPHKTSVITTKEHKALSTYQKDCNISHHPQSASLPFPLHPAAKCIGTHNLKPQQYKKFVHLLYFGLTYSTKNLKGPTDQYLKKKALLLPESSSNHPQSSSQTKKKFLMLDLDETLIHSVFDPSLPADVKLLADGNEFRFNVRPHCIQFLQNISQHYEVYVFTASTKDYAEPIVKYLNKKRKTIQGVLHRKNCLETVNGFKIKDLRIIKNRSLEDIIIVDNLVHSFGLQLQNGIPIIQFISNKDDRELLHLQKLLLQAKQHKDVRQFIRTHLNIRNCLDHPEKDFLDLNSQKWCLKKENTMVSSKLLRQKVLNHEKSALKTLLTCGV